MYSLQVLATQFKFYEAQRSGHLTNNDIPWRGDSGLGDVYGTTALHGGYYTDGGGWAAGASLACEICCRDACALPAPGCPREAGCRVACLRPAQSWIQQDCPPCLCPCMHCHHLGSSAVTGLSLDLSPCKGKLSPCEGCSPAHASGMTAAVLRCRLCQVWDAPCLHHHHAVLEPAGVSQGKHHKQKELVSCSPNLCKRPKASTCCARTGSS